MKQMNAEELVSRGQKLLAKKDFKGAVKAFSAALEKEDVVPTRNNLAFALFHAGDPRRALEVIQPTFTWDLTEFQRAMKQVIPGWKDPPKNE